MHQARRQLNWNGGGGMDSQYKLLSELLSDQAAFITSPKTSLANYWGGGEIVEHAGMTNTSGRSLWENT